MKFNIIMEDGGVFTNCLVLVNKGMAETKRDIHIAMKYQGGFCICNKYYRNYWIESLSVYDIEPIERIAIPQIEDVEEEDIQEDIGDNSLN